jgi:hypothetical protein
MPGQEKKKKKTFSRNAFFGEIKKNSFQKNCRKTDKNLL